MTQECLWTGGRAVRARLQHGNEIAGLRLSQLHFLRQKVERRAKRSHDGGNLTAPSVHAVTDNDRIVFSDDLAKVAGCGKVMMHASVHNQKNLASRNLAVYHSAHVDACLADQVTTQLEHELCAGHRTLYVLGQLSEILADRLQVERPVPGKVGYSEAAADVDELWGGGRIGGEPQGEIDVGYARARVFEDEA